jgi:hypothetical protein
VHTAKALYKECDGIEFESTANVIDMRYIPDDTTFHDQAPRDTATKVPGNYQPPPAFSTKSLQHTKVDLTWDEDDPVRQSKLVRVLIWTRLGFSLFD